MARDCIFYSESNDMGATIPFCNFEDSSDWNCCKYYDHRDSTQEHCPHYISRTDGLEMLRRTKSKMTRREKLQASITDDQLWNYICEVHQCSNCPIVKICTKVKREAEFKAWLDEEVEG